MYDSNGDDSNVLGTIATFAPSDWQGWLRACLVSTFIFIASVGTSRFCNAPATTQHSYKWIDPYYHYSKWSIVEFETEWINMIKWTDRAIMRYIINFVTKSTRWDFRTNYFREFLHFIDSIVLQWSSAILSFLFILSLSIMSSVKSDENIAVWSWE